MLSTLFLAALQFLYLVGAMGLAVYGLQALILALLKLREERLHHSTAAPACEGAASLLHDGELDWPAVTVQLPVYNELHVVERLINACAGLDYPHDRLQIHLLDDSTDATTSIAESRAAFWRSRGADVRAAPQRTPWV